MSDFDELLRWLSEPGRPQLSPQDSWLYYQLLRPSTVFIKTLRRNTQVLDFGAGLGGLVGLKNWPKPSRPDLRFFAYSLEYVADFEKYDGYEIGNFDLKPPRFHGIEFSAVFASHVIEHLA